MSHPRSRLNLHPFRPRLLADLRHYNRSRLLADVGAGLTVGVVALPLAMAFAIASGLTPQAGLFTAIVAGLVVSLLGGSSVQIAGPAGAFIVVVYGIVERHGLANLLIATSMAGVLMVAMGLLRLGVLVRYVPVSIVIGFTNGIAVLIGLSQLRDLLGLPIEKLPADFFSQIGVLAQVLPGWHPPALAIGLGCLALVVLWPKSYAMPAQPANWTQRLLRAMAHVPGTLVALVAATVLTAWLHLPVETIGSRFGGIPSALPALALPAFSWLGVKQLLVPTLTIAMLGAFESLLCARVADNLAAAPRHDPNQELMAQGLANIVTPLVGGLPATGTIARTVTNVRAGATSPVSGLVHALTLLAIVLLAAPWAEHVPLASLAGILLFVAWNMGEWHEFARLRQFNAPYRVILLGTFVSTVVFDLTVAVELGLVLSCVFFIWRMSTLFGVHPEPSGEPGVQRHALYGALFFGAVGKVEALGNVPPGTQRVVLDLHRLVLMDTSGLAALQQLHVQLKASGVRLQLRNINPQAWSLLARSGFAQVLGADATPANAPPDTVVHGRDGA